MKIGQVILLSVIVWFLYAALASNRESFLCVGSHCPTQRNSSSVCHQLAQAQCQIPSYPLNSCWLNAFSACNKSCLRAGGKVCDCDGYATKRCQSSSSPADGCYRSVLQKCMAGMGFAADPDRG